MFDNPTFEDVMEAAQFKSVKAILDHFSPKANNKSNVDSGDIREFFRKEQWIFFLELNSLANEELHSSLYQSDGKTTIVLPSTLFNPELVQDVMERIGFDATQLVIKNADSDLS
jgi:hypothetical protein